MKSFPVQYIYSRRLKPEFQNTKQLLCHFCNGLFKIHFYTDMVECLLARSLHIHIQIFSLVNNNSFIISILTRFAISQQNKYSILNC